MKQGEKKEERRRRRKEYGVEGKGKSCKEGGRKA